jgi:hypothetical protein
MASHGIHSQPSIEWSDPAEELAIVISKTDPGEDPDEGFRIMIIQVLDLASNDFPCEKVQRHEGHRSCAL